MQILLLWTHDGILRLLRQSYINDIIKSIRIMDGEN